MCGRYTLTHVDPNVLGPLFDLFSAERDTALSLFPEDLAPRYNICPTQNAPIVRVLSKNAPRMLSLAQWGLVPSWAKDPILGSKMINARSETASEKPAFRSSFKSKRCLVPTDGFFEWKKVAAGKKQPYWIHRQDNLPFAFAGLWARWKEPTSGASLESFTILTTDATGAIADIHDRMPVVLPKESFAAWLDPDEQRIEWLDALVHDNQPWDPMVTAVSTRVNNPHNDSPENIVPVSLSIPATKAAHGPEHGMGASQLAIPGLSRLK